MFEPQEGMTMRELVEWTRYAEDSGYGYIFRSDHLLPTSGARGLDSPECWVSLAAMAAATKRIKFGSLVSPVGFRNPALLARMACSVQALSEGRLQLGVGAGWYKDEYLAHGFDFPEVPVRQRQLREALRIIAPLVRGERVDFDGKQFSAHTDVLPKPTTPIHLIVGGRARSSVRSAAEFADEWNLYSPSIQQFQRLKAFLDSKTSRKIEVSQMAPFLIAENRRDLERAAERLMRRRSVASSVETFMKELKTDGGTIVGTNDEFAAQIGERLDLGIEKFYFQILDTRDRKAADLLTETLRANP
jgi:alkanesulfonate monooxygenase SsuD/methylene tetrahydromethanopterin reductase-like flavin-dependent oxidoreductase (luciferase family)